MLTLATFGCSSSFDGEAGPAIEEPASTTEAVQPATTTQPDPAPTTAATADQGAAPTAEQPEPAPTTTQPAPTTTPPTTTRPDPAPITTQPAAAPEVVAGQDEPTPADDDDDPGAFDDSSAEPSSNGTSASEPSGSEDSKTEDSGSESVFEPVDSAAFPEEVRERLLRWGDGFLHMQYLFSSTSEGSCDFGRFRTRFSTDGMEWTEFSDLEVPSVHTKPTLLSQLGLDSLDCWFKTDGAAEHISSDGEHFVIASQWPNYLDTWKGRNASDAAWLDQLLENPPSISVSITTDLVNWETIDIPIPRPEGLHASLQAAPSLVGLSLSEHGWLLEQQTVTYMNLFSLMPADIKASADRIEPTWDGPWHDESTGESGMAVQWWTDEDSSRDPHTRFVSWEELGTTEDLFYDYGATANKPYHPSRRYSGSILVAPWGDSPTRFGLPDVHQCCTVWTESGFVSLTDPSEAGYAPWWFGSGNVVFSPDGETWDVKGPIAGEDTLVTRIAAVDSGVIAFGSTADEYDSKIGDDPDLVPRTIYWLAESDGSNWQEIELPDGTDLIEWLMANGRTPINWPHLAVNGNIVLRIGDGRIERHVVPE